VSNPWVLGTITFKDKKGDVSTEELLFAPEAGFTALLLANPCQIIWDLLTVYLRYMKVDKDNAKKSCCFLAFQILIAFFFCFTTFYSLHLMISVFETGDSFLVFVTFAIVYAVDQIKQFGTLAVIYLVVVRRFGFLKENEREF